MVEKDAQAGTAEDSSAKLANSEPSKARKRSSVVRPFPVFSLERALSIVDAIKDKNAGNPWPPTEVAKAVGIGEKSSALDQITRAAALYGLTTGSRGTSAISLEKIGRDIAYAPNPESIIEARRRAFLNVDLFAKVIEYYHGNNLPEMSFLSNILYAQFSLPKELHEEFRSVFEENCRFCSIGSEWTGLDTPVGHVRREERSAATPPTIKSFAATENRNGMSCFVIMPFTERNPKRPPGFFEEVFAHLIKPAAEAAGFDVSTANKDGSDVIQSTIINEILESDLVIADLTDHNPNVLFELGIRMAQEKAVAIIKSSDTGRIFDVDNMLRVFEYSENLWVSTVKVDAPGLEGHIRATWEGRASTRSYVSILRSRT